MAAKKRTAKPLPPIERGPDPFRETIEIARGDNPDGLAHLTAAAHKEAQRDTKPLRDPDAFPVEET